MKFLDPDDPELKKRLEFLHRTKVEIPEEIDFPVNYDIYECAKLREELKMITSSYNAVAISEVAFKWLQVKNPFYIDKAVIMCNKIGLTPTPTLQKIINEVAEARFNGSLSGTPGKIIKESAKNHALMVMLNFIYDGHDRNITVSKTISWFKMAYPDLKPYTETTLEKYYRETYNQEVNLYGRNMTLEQQQFSSWDRFCDIDPSFKKGRKVWKEIFKTLPMSGEL